MWVCSFRKDLFQVHGPEEVLTLYWTERQESSLQEQLRWRQLCVRI